MNEILNTKVYVFDFIEVANTDYAYVITTNGYDTIGGIAFADTSG